MLFPKLHPLAHPFPTKFPLPFPPKPRLLPLTSSARRQNLPFPGSRRRRIVNKSHYFLTPPQPPLHWSSPYHPSTLSMHAARTYLSQEVVGAVSVVVPDGDLEGAGLEFRAAQRAVVEGLVPAWIKGVADGFGPSLRLLAVTIETRRWRRG